MNNTFILPPYPPSTPDHECKYFETPEGTYRLGHSIFVNSMQPLYSVGTTASLISVKYKEAVSNNLQRYEAQPGARSFRRIFSNNNVPTLANSESDEESTGIVFRTPSLSSSSSSHKNTTLGTPLSHSIPEEESPTPTSTLSFLARNHTIGRHPRKPKTNITKTNSSFVQRIITNDQLAKILMARTSEDTYLFYNCGTSFVWADAAGHPKVYNISNGYHYEFFFFNFCKY